MLYVIVIVLLCSNICFMLDPLENKMVHLKGLSINRNLEHTSMIFAVCFLCRWILSHVHYNIIQRFAFQVRHSGIRSRVTNREQHQQLLIGWSLEEQPELGTAVKGR